MGEIRLLALGRTIWCRSDTKQANEKEVLRMLGNAVRGNTLRDEDPHSTKLGLEHTLPPLLSLCLPSLPLNPVLTGANAHSHIKPTTTKGTPLFFFFCAFKAHSCFSLVLSDCSLRNGDSDTVPLQQS